VPGTGHGAHFSAHSEILSHLAGLTQILHMQPYWAQWPYLARFVVLNNPKQMKYHVYKGSEMQLSISHCSTSLLALPTKARILCLDSL